MTATLSVLSESKKGAKHPCNSLHPSSSGNRFINADTSTQRWPCYADQVKESMSQSVGCLVSLSGAIIIRIVRSNLIRIVSAITFRNYQYSW